MLLAFRDDPPDRMIVWWPGVVGCRLDVDVDGIERRAVVVLGHVGSRGGVIGEQAARRRSKGSQIFSPKYSTPPAPPSGQPIASYRGRVWVYVRG